MRARLVLVNAAPWVLQGLLGMDRDPATKPSGAQLKVNFLLNRLPRLKSGADARVAFAGTLHLNDDYPDLERARDDGCVVRFRGTQAAGVAPNSLQFDSDARKHVTPTVVVRIAAAAMVLSR